MGSNNQAQIIEIPFSRGLRQDLETVLMPQGGLVDCNNVTFDKTNRLKRRAAFTALGTAKYSKGSTWSGPTQRTGTGARGECLAFANDDLYAYIPSEDKTCSAGQYVSSTAFPSTLRAQLLSRFNVGANPSGQVFFSDCAAVSGHNSQTWLAVIYTQTDNTLSSNQVTYLDLINTVTSERVISAQVIANTAAQNGQPRVISLGALLFVLVPDAVNNIGLTKIDLSGATPSTTAVGNIITDGDATNTFFDASITLGGFVVAYRSNNAGNRRCMVRTFDTNGSLLNTFNGATGWRNSTGAGFWSTPCIAVCGAPTVNDRIYAIGYDPGNSKIEYASFTTTLGAIQQNSAASSSISIVTIARVATNYALAQFSRNVSGTLSAPRGNVAQSLLHDTGTLAVTSLLPFCNYTPASRIFLDSSSGGIFSLTRFNDPSPASPVPNAQNHLLLVDWGTGNAPEAGLPQAHVGSGLVPLPAESSTPSMGGLADLGSGNFAFTSILNLGTSAANGQQVAVYLGTVQGPQRFLNLVAHNTMHVGGGTPLSYDGQRLVELGFYSYPAMGFPAVNNTATTGGSLRAGVYFYRFTWEWTDAQGMLHRSDASPAFQVDISSSATSTNSIGFLPPALYATRKQRYLQSTVTDLSAPVRLVCWRTIAGGSVFHRSSGFSFNVTNGSSTLAVLTDTDCDQSVLIGTDTSSTVDTSANKTIRLRTASARSFTAITVTSGVTTSKTQIVTDLNTAFLSNNLPLTASITGTNQVKILGSGLYLEVDTVGNGSNLNTAIGLANAGQIVTGNLSAAEILYVDSTGANELPNTCPPPSLMMCSQGGRLWGLDIEYPERIWCTKTFQDNISPAYSSALQVLVPGAGKINGIAAQDDKIFALAETGTFIAAYGDGPDNTGQTGTFPTPALTSVSANCDDPRGVITGDDGIYFTGQDQQTTTIYFMPRGAASPTGIGNRIRTLLGTYSVCRGAVYRQEKARMEFLFVDNDVNPTGHRLVYYHYRLKDEEQIGQFTSNIVGLSQVPNSIGDWSTTGANRHATVLGHTGLALQSDTGNTDPSGLAVAYMWQTGDIRPLGMLGYTQNYSANLLATSQAADDFILTASYDSGVSFSEQSDFAISETSGPVLRRWESPTKQLPYGSVMFKCTQNLSDAGTIFHSLVLEVVPMGGLTRLPAAKMA